MLRRDYFFQFAVPAKLPGFLPAYHPQTSLPPVNEYQIMLNEIAGKLHQLLRAKQFRKSVDQLNEKFAEAELVIDINSESEKNAAILILSAMAQAYIFEDTAQPIRHVPAVIAGNLYKLCVANTRFPVMTYTDYILHNWRVLDESQKISLDNIEPIITFTGMEDENWFIKIHVVLEHMATSAMISLHDAFCAAQPNNTDLDTLAKSLTSIKESLHDCTLLMRRMIEHCKPDIFLNQIRPCLMSWSTVKPRDSEVSGVRFEGIEETYRTPYQFSGSSGAQSSILPAIDAALSIRHEIDGMHLKLLEYKKYMPNQHQSYISFLAGSNIRRVIIESESAELMCIYNDVISAIARLRGAHIGLVHSHIHKPTTDTGASIENMSGTGGSSMEGFLASRLNTTFMSSIKK